MNLEVCQCGGQTDAFKFKSLPLESEHWEVWATKFKHTNSMLSKHSGMSTSICQSKNKWSEKRKTYWPRVQESYLISKSVMFWLTSKLRRRRKRMDQCLGTSAHAASNGLLLYFENQTYRLRFRFSGFTSSGWLLLHLSSTVLLIKIHSDRLVINTRLC